MRPSEKESLEVEKLKGEIAKFKRETRISYWDRWKFWIGSVGVPISVAALTFYAVYKTGYFNAWQKQNENAQFKFTQDTTAFRVIRVNLLKSNDSLVHKVDSLTKLENNLLALILHYKALIAGGLSKDEKINALISENSKLRSSNLKVTNDSLMTVLDKCRGDLGLAGADIQKEIYQRSKGEESFNFIIAAYKDSLRDLRLSIKNNK